MWWCMWSLALVGCAVAVGNDRPDSTPPRQPPSAIAMLASPDWGDVLAARRVLVAERARSLPALVEMIERDERVPLVNTIDLIYPGAKRFYGHGRIVSYDLDHLGDRAGWVLETTTFHDFGFSDGIHGEVQIDPAGAPARRQRARAAVHAWWQRAQQGWSCYEALGDELRGPKPALAYAWLLDLQPPPCDGFSAARFRADLLPIVQAHARDRDQPMHDAAAALLDDLDEALARLSGE